MIIKSKSVSKNNNKENNSLYNENLNKISNSQIKSNNYLNPSLLPQINNNTINEKMFKSPNINKNSNKSLLSKYLSSIKNNDNNNTIKFEDKNQKGINYFSFRQALRKRTRIKNDKEGKNYNLLDDIKVINNYNKKELYENPIDYDYSLIIKKLDNWDKEHCIKNKMDLFSLHNTLNNYYKNNNLIEEQKNLRTMDNMLQEKINYYRYKENKTYGILGKKSKTKNNIIKKNDSAEINENNKNIMFNSLIINNLNKSYTKNKIDFFNKMNKEKLKYEHQLHKELIFVNNIIYNKKYIKKQKTKELDNFFKDLDKLKNEYENKIDNYKKKYYFKYNEVSQEENTIISEKLNETKYNHNNKSRIDSPKKKSKKVISNEIKVLEFRRKTRMSTIRSEMTKALDKIKYEYNLKFGELYKRKEKLENELNIINGELNYYRIINDELLREHQFYYLDVLKKGKDCRNEGLVWVVKKLFELQINLEYHHFPKYLTHEQINYLKKLAYLTLEENELKIILKILKKKQKDDRENTTIEYMNFFDTLTNEDPKNKNESNSLNLDKQIKSYDEETLLVKRKIDQKFLKVYKNNEEALKFYLTKSLEDEKLQTIIYYIKKALYNNNNSFVKENKISIIEAFLGKTKNKDLFGLILGITKRLYDIEQSKKSMINKEREYYIDRTKINNGINIQTYDHPSNRELIKNCLFGNKIDF